MILVDTSVWIGHLRKADGELTRLLNEEKVLTHAFVIGEIALGSIKNRDLVIKSLAELPSVAQASDDEVLGFIEVEALAGSGIGYLDAHLLASVKLTPGAKIWTRDKRLNAAATVADLARVTGN
jgi:predicted nucleic acid-binding protein